MIRINLLPFREISAEFGRRQELTVASGILGLTVIVLAGLYWMQFRNVSALEAELVNLRQEVEALNAKAKGVGELEKKVAELKEKLVVIDTLNKKKTGPVRIMDSLSAATPARLWLTQFREAGGIATIDGLAVDNQTIAEFLKALANSPYFNNVELIETAQTELEGVPLKRFSLNSRLIYQPPEPNGKKEAAKN